ncbi:TPA: glycosyltransferase family 2 protein [Escherichia coli]|nr:glycosyltransferase [Escherichia coli]HAH4433228.1 glycosyltransferase family 2 protein [Escherichia coli]HAH4447661.1 glycosyltransferase family 2 protein [Escherichia coli]
MIYISVCIPTKNRLDYLTKTVESIINDNVDVHAYEIVIADNSDDDLTEKYARELMDSGYNIKYYKNPQTGFYNSIQALQLGDGAFLKLHNDYTSFNKGGFKKLFDHVVKNYDSRNMLFFTNGALGAVSTKYECTSFDKFVFNASYLITWSSSFSIWKDDFIELETKPDDLNEMFPHTSLILQSNNKIFSIVDESIFNNISVSRKGGYNIFYNFCVLFLDMLDIEKKKGLLSEKTIKKVKRDMYYKFVMVWYYRTIQNNKRRYTFDNENAYENIKKAYGFIGFSGVFLVAKAKYFFDKIFGFFVKS